MIDQDDYMILDDEGFAICPLCGAYDRLTEDGWCTFCDEQEEDE